MKSKTTVKKKKRAPLTLPKLTAKCQRIFNEYIRLRDAGDRCISCGSDKANQAGHSFPVRQYSALRFTPLNVHLQCAYCNAYLHGNQANYRMGLVEKVGEQQVYQLELLSRRVKSYKWTRKDLEIIIEQYQLEIERMKNGVQQERLQNSEATV